MARKPAKPKTTAPKKPPKPTTKPPEPATKEAAKTADQQPIPPASAPKETPKSEAKPDYSPSFLRAFGFMTGDNVEGGYVNDPRDPGGETKFGISKRSYPKVDIKNLTLEAAMEITHRDFWKKLRCDDMPEAIATVTLDCGFNQGPAISGRLLQKSLGNVTVDGVIGPQTLAAVEAHSNHTELALSFMGWRMRRYAFTANADRFMRGWSIRVQRLVMHLAAAKALTLPEVSPSA